jgi:DNA polymerase-1
MSYALVDANFFLHRALHLPVYQRMQTRAGVCTGGALGFLKTLSFSLHRTRARQVLLVWDAGRSARRLQLWPGYKQGRKHEANGFDYAGALQTSFALLREVAPRLALRTLEVRGREADDVLSWCARLLAGQGKSVLVLSEDLDLCQLVGANVVVYRPMADEFVHADRFFARFGVEPDEWLLYRAIVGDRSDNIPGVRGVGPVRLKACLDHLRATSGSPAVSRRMLREHCQGSSSKVLVRVAEEWETVRRNLRLIDTREERFTDPETRAMAAALDQPAVFDPRAVRRWLRAQEAAATLQSFSVWASTFRELR